MGEKSDLARKKILDEFHYLICRQGYKQISLRQLGDICGMSTGHINFYFKKKEDLMIAICENYFVKAYSIIDDVKSDNFTKFFLHQLLLCYLTSLRKPTYKFASEIAENGFLITWRAKKTYEYALPALRSVNIKESDDLIYDACLIAISSMYAIIRKNYNNKKDLKYERVFFIFTKSFFTQINFHESDKYIENVLNIFSSLDKNSLFKKFLLIIENETPGVCDTNAAPLF